MPGMTPHLANEINDHLLRGETYAGPSSYWLGLIKSFTNDTTWTEADYTGYARVEVAQGTSTWDAASNGSTAINLASDLVFPKNTGSNQNVTHLGIWDASTSGNLLWVDAITGQPVTIATSDKPFIGDGDVTIDSDAN